jgi:translation initiation factor 2B subunit (eIF-2B alpha/beta/delta family)
MRSTTPAEARIRPMRQPPDDHAAPPSDELANVLARVRADREHGASWLARDVARALASAAANPPLDGTAADHAAERQAAELRRGARELAHARPSMAALATTVARICAAGWPAGAAVHPLTPDGALPAREALARLRVAAQQLATAWDEAASAIFGHARPLLHGTVLTHSRSGTVERVLTLLAASPAVLAGAIVTESRPGGEGVATARALAAAGLPVTLVADAAAGLVAGQASCVVLGADSVRDDGSLVNKVGSYPLALAAHAAGVPVYVLCETLKFAPAGWPLVLEEMDPAELLPEPVAGLTVRNVYFDRTPAEYVTAIVTEQGTLQPDAVRPYAEATARALAALDQA